MKVYMTSAFVSRSPAPKTKEQKKVSALAKRISSATRKAHQSGPCVVLFKQAPKEA